MFDKNRNQYDQYIVDREAPLLEWLLSSIPGSKSKIKATLHGHGIKVDGKQVTQFDFPLKPGMKISVSRSKKNDTFKSRYVDIVYEDKWIVVIDKKIGILSMAAGHKSLNVKSVLDDYFKRSRQKCTAHVVHRLDRDTSGLMIYAKDMETEQLLERDWHGTVFDRRYVAVVSGEMENDEGTVANWLKTTRLMSHSLLQWIMEENTQSLIITRSNARQSTVWWNSNLRQEERTRYACTPLIWGIPSAEM